MKNQTTGTLLYQTRTSSDRLWREVMAAVIICILAAGAAYFLLSAMHHRRISEARPRSGTLIVNKLGDIVEWNAQEVAGWSADEVFGTSFVNLMPRSKREECRQRMQFAIDRKVLLSTECAIKSKSGQMMPIRFTMREYDDARFALKIVTR